MSATPEQLEAACKLGRIQGGWDVAPKRRVATRTPPLIDVQDSLIVTTFERCEHNVARTARRLVCSRTTIYGCLYRLGILTPRKSNIVPMVSMLIVGLLAGCATNRTERSPVASDTLAAPQGALRASAQSVEALTVTPTITLTWDHHYAQYYATTYQFVHRTNLTTAPWQNITKVVGTNCGTFPRTLPEEYFTISKCWLTGVPSEGWTNSAVK